MPLGELDYWKSNSVMKGTDRVSSRLLSLSATRIGAEIKVLGFKQATGSSLKTITLAACRN